MEPEQACPMCLEVYSSPERPRCVAPCRHGFCEPCGFELLRRPHREWRCPICRLNIAVWMAEEFCWCPDPLQSVSMDEIAAYVERTARIIEASGGQPELLRLAERILQELPH